MHDLQSMMEDPHLVATGFFQTVEHPSFGAMKIMRPAMQFSETPASVQRLPPVLGEHGIEILRENGISDAEIEHLRESGVLILPGAPTPAI
jgi:crotonobetainyl-CoA:carnitine CoA-transferase CaiB-like acyl-CoA transferase